MARSEGNGRPVGGLRRLLDAPQPQSTVDLRRFLQPKERPQPGEVCEMCAEPIGDEHSHVVNMETRTLSCVDRACYLLFTHEGAAAGKFKAVPDRRIHDPGFALTDIQWEALQIPVGIAFFFENSQMGHSVAFYPSPAGATESLLPLDTWSEVVAANPMLQTMEADVEALLVYRPKHGGMHAFLVPIDVCYELVGHIRRDWKGFDGGEKAWTAINAFFDRLAERARPWKTPA
ncbi:MAG: DUF5947 family protein [Candidatus Limnocylindria bacterium]